MKKLNTHFAEMIPIVLFFLFFIYPDDMLRFSYSYLGRFLSVALIIFYTSIHIIYGAFICAVIILYYQSDVVEGMMFFENPEFNASSYYSVEKPCNKVLTVNGEIMEEPKKQINNHNSLEIYDFIIDPPDDIVIDIENTGLSEDFSYTGRDIFRKKNCKNGQLYHLSQPIKSEFADIIFPELKFNNDATCNPCDPMCNYSIIDNRLETEELLFYKR